MLSWIKSVPAIAARTYDLSQRPSTMASKEDMKAVEDRLTTRLDGIESRLGRIENLLMEEHKRKIENLET